MTTEQEIINKVKEFRAIGQKVNHFDPNINDKSTRLYKFRYNKDSKFKIWIFTGRIKIETALDTSLLFSINFPDKVCLANKFLEEINGLGKIFSDNSNDDQIQSCIKLLKNDLKSLNLVSNEGLTVYRNSLQLTLKQDRQLLPEIEACNKIKSLIELNFPEETNNTDYSDLPGDLRPILQKFEYLAITDDFERDEKIQGFTEQQCSDLIKIIEPKIGEINSFLDTFGVNPLSEGALRLQSLAEMLIELTNDQSYKHEKHSDKN